MPFEPNWIHGPDVLGAISAGAAAGARARSQTDEENEAANRLALSYQTLAQEQQQQAQQTAAVNALRMAQQTSLANYRQQQVKNQEQRITDAEAAKKAAQDLTDMTNTDTAGFLEALPDVGAKAALDKYPHADKSTVWKAMAEENANKKGDRTSMGKLDFPAPGQTGTTAADTIRFTGVPLNDPVINSVLGTNAPPGTGTNYVNALRMAQQQSRLPSVSNASPPSGAGPIVQGATIAATGANDSGNNEVARKTKDGRTAIFDATTKKFLRYADDASQ
jgi:hypothetical protein